MTQADLAAQRSPDSSRTFAGRNRFPSPLLPCSLSLALLWLMLVLCGQTSQWLSLYAPPYSPRDPSFGWALLSDSNGIALLYNYLLLMWVATLLCVRIGPTLFCELLYLIAIVLILQQRLYLQNQHMFAGPGFDLVEYFATAAAILLLAMTIRLTADLGQRQARVSLCRLFGWTAIIAVYLAIVGYYGVNSAVFQLRFRAMPSVVMMLSFVGRQLFIAAGPMIAVAYAGRRAGWLFWCLSIPSAAGGTLVCYWATSKYLMPGLREEMLYFTTLQTFCLAISVLPLMWPPKRERLASDDDESPAPTSPV